MTKASVGTLLMSGWRVWLPVVAGNAAVQAAAVAPAFTPALGAGFVAMAVVSMLALIASAALVVQAMSAERERVWPGRRIWLGASAALVGVAGLAAVTLPAIPVALVLALIVLSGLASGGWWAGFRLFATAPVRAIAVTIVTLLAIVLLGVGGLLLGFLVTGPLGAAMTWLAVGTVAVLLVAAWTAPIRRSVGTSATR